MRPREGRAHREDDQFKIRPFPEAGFGKIHIPAKAGLPERGLLIEVRPAEKGHVMEVRPAEVGLAMEVHPAELDPMMELRPAEGGFETEVCPVEPNPAVELRPAKPSRVQLHPAEEGPAMEVRLIEPGLALDLRLVEQGPVLELRLVEPGPVLELRPVEHGRAMEVRPVEPGPAMEVRPAEPGLALELRPVEPGRAMEVRLAEGGPPWKNPSTEVDMLGVNNDRPATFRFLVVGMRPRKKPKGGEVRALAIQSCVASFRGFNSPQGLRSADQRPSASMVLRSVSIPSAHAFQACLPWLNSAIVSSWFMPPPAFAKPSFPLP